MLQSIKRAFETGMIPTILLTGSLSLNVFLALHFDKKVVIKERDEQLTTGMYLPSLKAYRRGVGQAAIRWSSPQDSRQTLLYVFSPQCGWCIKNASNIRHLVSQTSSTYRVVGISLSEDGIDDYIRKNNFEFAIYTDVKDEQGVAPKFLTTPYTLVVSHEGLIVQAWAGAYSGKIATLVEHAFNLHLPGLSETVH